MITHEERVLIQHKHGVAPSDKKLRLNLAYDVSTASKSSIQCDIRADAVQYRTGSQAPHGVMALKFCNNKQNNENITFSKNRYDNNRYKNNNYHKTLVNEKTQLKYMTLMTMCFIISVSLFIRLSNQTTQSK